MEFDYEESIKLLRVRQKQIEQAALEDDTLNTEYIEINKIINAMYLIIKAQNKEANNA